VCFYFYFYWLYLLRGREKYDVENKWGNVTTLVRKVTLGPLFVTENQLNDIGRGITIVVKASGEHVRIPGGSGYSCFGAI
jgi:hypothetical protein